MELRVWKTNLYNIFLLCYVCLSKTCFHHLDLLFSIMLLSVCIDGRKKKERKKERFEWCLHAEKNALLERLMRCDCRNWCRNWHA